MIVDPGSQFRDWLRAEVEQIAKGMIGNLQTPVAAQANGALASDGHRVLNFQGPGVTVTDDSANRRANIFIPGTPISGGSALTTTIVQFSLPGTKILDLWNGSSNNAPPANWFTPGFNDTAWTTPGSLTNTGPTYGNTPAYATGGALRNLLQRETTTIPTGSLVSATLNYAFDSANVGGAIWVNGTSISGTGLHDATGVVVPTSDLVPGGTNVIALECGNNSALNSDMGGSFVLTLTYRGAGFGTNYVNLQDQKAQNTTSGTFTSGAWRRRDMNTIVVDDTGGASIATNQIVLPSGTYRVRIRCPAFAVDRNQTRLQNITDSTTLLTGTSEFAPNSGIQSESTITGRITLGTAKTLEIQHWGSTTQTVRGFGVEANISTEVFTVAEFWKEG